MHRITLALLALGLAAGCGSAYPDDSALESDATIATGAATADLAGLTLDAAGGLHAAPAETDAPEPEQATDAAPQADAAPDATVVVPESELLAAQLRAALSAWVEACSVDPDALTVADVDPEHANVRLAPMSDVSIACDRAPGAVTMGCTEHAPGAHGPGAVWMVFADRLTSAPLGSPTPACVVLHEVGHALGAYGHLPTDTDVMSERDSGTERPTAADCELVRGQAAP
jgi:hypothetical protein